MSVIGIEIFEGVENSKGTSCCSSGCSCNSGTYVSTKDLITRFKNKYSVGYDINLYSITDNDIDLIDRVNDIFLNSGERIKITRNNFKMIYPKLVPMIVVNGKIVGVKVYPTEDELHHAITKGLKISTKASCC